MFKMPKDKKFDSIIDDSIYSMILPSILGMLLCAVCLAGMTFAWFNASVSTGAMTIQSSSYSVDVMITRGDTLIYPNTDGVYTLEPSTYSVKITAQGTATKGYCVLEFENQYFVTDQITADGAGTLFFNLTLKDKLDMKIIPQWGSSSEDAPDVTNTETLVVSAVAAPPIQNTDTTLPNTTSQSITTPAVTEAITTEKVTETETVTVTEAITQTQTETKPVVTTQAVTEKTFTYVIQKGDTLSKIASQFGTTVAKLQSINGIKDPSHIEAGAKIQIPGDPPKATQTTKEQTEAPATTVIDTTIKETESVTIAETTAKETEPETTAESTAKETEPETTAESTAKETEPETTAESTVKETEHETALGTTQIEITAE